MQPWLSRLIDDGSAVPRSAMLAERLAAHRQRLGTPSGEMLGSFVLTDTRLGDLADHVSADAPLRALVLVTGGAGALEPACRWVARVEGLDAVSLAIALRDEQDLAHNAARVVAMLDHLHGAGDLGEEVPTYVEVPDVAEVGEHAWGAALDVLAAADLRLTLRADDPARLPRAIDAALDRELRFRCVGSDVVGPLQALAATHAALDGGDVGAALADRHPSLGAAALESARRWCTGHETDRPDEVCEALLT